MLFRTRLQAEISGKGSEDFSVNFPSTESEPLIPEVKTPIKELELPEKNNSSFLPATKNPKLILFKILKTAGGKIEKEELQQKAFEKGITQEKFETILKNLLETGELYSPQPGIIKIV